MSVSPLIETSEHEAPTRSTTLKMVAEACGLSIAAVSLCLRYPDNPRFTEATRKLIQAKARELNYIPNRLAASLREGRTHFLSLVVPWNTPELLDSAELEATAQGYGMSIHFTVSPDLEAERKAIHHALGQHVDGLIWLPSDTAWGYTRTINRLRQSNTRTVFLESALPGLPEAGLVEVDYETNLLKVLEGFRRDGLEELILFTPGTGHQLRARRAAVFSGFCQRHGLRGDIVEVKGEAEIRVRCGKIKRRAGILCEGDWMGLDVLHFAESKGIEFPRDIHLVVLGDILMGSRFRVGEISRPKMSAIRRPSGEMARLAVKMLAESLRANTKDQLPRQMLHSTWVPRGTTPEGEVRS